MSNSLNITPNNNDVRITSNNNVVTVITNDSNLINVTQPVTNVIEVLTGPIGPKGDPGIGGESVFNPVGSGYFTTSSLWITGSFTISGSNTFTNVGPTILSGSVTIIDDVFLIKSGSKNVFTVDNQGSTIISSSASNLFLIKDNNNSPVLIVSQSGIVVFSTQSTELTNPAPNGAIYFTSSSFFVGLD